MSLRNSTVPIVALLTLVVAGLTAPVNESRGAEAEEIGGRFKCQFCHTNRLRELKKPKGPTLVDPESIWLGEHGRQEPASTRRMCLSCHDGFVADARYIWTGEHMTHPVGVKPPESMNMTMVDGDPVFPLNEDGEVYCGTCHVAHLGEGAAANGPPFVRVDPEKGELCSNCHSDKTSVGGTPHARVKKSKQPPDFTKRGICGKCHTPHKNSGPLMFAKKPRKGNTTVNTLCQGCHRGQPDPGEHPATVVAWSQATREALGAKPTTEMPVFDENANHADRGAIGCGTCHNPHQHRADGLPDDVPGYFLRVADTKGFLCADCHASSSLFRYKFFHSKKSRGSGR
jgi:predicted CXXCH cytochrome family protein